MFTNPVQPQTQARLAIQPRPTLVQIYPGRGLILGILIGIMGMGAGPTCSTTQGLSDSLDDAGISTRAQALILQGGLVNPLSINVTTDEGEVFLIGRVRTRDDRELAERQARQAEGVWSVINHLKVGPFTGDPTAGQTRDRDMRNAIDGRLQSESRWLARNVRVITDEGEAFLFGRVRNEMQRRDAVRLTREAAPDLKAVHNYLKAGRKLEVEE